MKVKDLPLDYTVSRSNRKTMALYIRKDGGVEVRCPLHSRDPEIKKFVAENMQWIEKKSAEMAGKAKKRAGFRLIPGCSLKLLGKDYRLTVSNNGMAGFDGTDFYVPAETPPETTKKLIIKIYKNLAERRLKTRTAEIAAAMKRQPVNVKINAAKTRWGSCSGKNSINYSWRLIMAEERCIDYVIIHELAHMTERNHGKSFWALVKTYMPDYKEQEKKLKQLQEKLSVENWED